MQNLGIDAGASTVKIIVIENGGIKNNIVIPHHGKIAEVLLYGIKKLDIDESFNICITGANSRRIKDAFPGINETEDIPAIAEGAVFLAPEAESIIEIGSESAEFITDIKKKAPLFSVNEHCAGGTGSFFEDQMSRLGFDITDYSDLVRDAVEIPRLSGRCAVFAKTDIIHRQQEGVPKQDILLGLCYAMIRNYKTAIVKNLPVKKPVVFCGGVAKNEGVIRAIRDIFALSENELIIPPYAEFAGAAGAALNACSSITKTELINGLQNIKTSYKDKSSLKRLYLPEGIILKDPVCTEEIPAEGVYLGVDAGSTSTDLVLTDNDGRLLSFQYLRTAGDPEKAVRQGMKYIKNKFPGIKILGVGITGSGRERLGRMMGADAVKDEITAQAKAAVHFFPDADTVFEIGGQDSKFISLEKGEVSDFRMNKICAAGTGSFIEEQTARMNIPVEEFGPLALTSTAPCDLGERCTVFIETAIAEAEAQGAATEDIAAGLCHSVVKNYLHKVVGNKKTGNKIILQGGVDYNPGIVAAFYSEYADKINVSPVFSVSGSFGASLLAKEAVKGKESRFKGFDFPSAENSSLVSDEEIKKNKAFYRRAGKILSEGYDPVIDSSKKTVGIPLSLIMFKFFPLANAFFKALGFNVILSDPTNEETISLSQQYARGETCYPVKLLYGHMMQLAEKNVDYIFLPRIHTIRHPHSHAVHNYACPYMQVAAKAVFDSLKLSERGIKLLSPVLDLDLGAQMMGKAMLQTGKELGFSKPRCLPGLIKGAKAVMSKSADVEKLGRELLSSLKPDDKVLVLITRNYGISDPVLNMGIPALLLERGYKVITLGHLPGMALDISEDYPNMYWPFGDHILSGAKLIANHPNLYAVYLTNHGCGPDTLISHMFKEEMGDKPYLHIEVDEHFSKVGVITRIEAFLNSISHRPPVSLPEDFEIRNVKMKPAEIISEPLKDKKLLIPDLGLYTPYIIDYYIKKGCDAAAMPAFDREALTLGRAQMNSKEYLPLPMLTGSILKAAEEYGSLDKLQFLIPFSYGADADGQYPRAIRTVLDSMGYENCVIVSPVLEEIPDNEDITYLMRAILTGDVLYSLKPEDRIKLAPSSIPSEEELITIAGMAGSISKKPIAVVGSPLCVFSLDEGIFSRLENEGREIRRMPLSEMLWFLWKDNMRDINTAEIMRAAEALGARSPFAKRPEELFDCAEKYLEAFAGNNGRYRYAKTADMGADAVGVISVSPRYENTAGVLSLMDIAENSPAPVLELSLDGDRDESINSRLRSFLYYCK